MLPVQIRQALSTLLERLQGSSIEWRLGGSVALALQGLEVSPRDVDLFLPSGDAARLMAETLGEFVESPPHRRTSEPFTSYRGHCRIETVEIDLIGELVIETPQGRVELGAHSLLWRRESSLPFQGWKVPSIPLEIQLVTYYLMPEREERVNQITSLLKDRGDLQLLDEFLAEQAITPPVTAGIRSLLRKEE
jgi:hypothetical protein